MENRILHFIKKHLLNKTPNSQAFFNIISIVIIRSLSFITVPIFTNLLTVENYGIISIYTTWLLVYEIFVGLQVASSIGSATVHISPEKQKAYFSSILTLSFLSFISIFLLTVLFVGPISKILELSEFLIIVMVIESFSAFIIGFITSKNIFYKDAHKNLIISLLTSIMSILLSILFIFNIPNVNDRYIGKILGGLLPGAVIAIYFIIVIFKEGKVFYNKEFWKFCLPLSIPIIPHILSHVIISQSDRIMIQKLIENSDYQIGIYSFAYNFATILNTIYSALNNAWVSFYYGALKEKKIDLLNKKLINYLLLFTTLTAGFILLSPEVIKVFANKNYWVAMDFIPLLCLGFYFVFLYSFPVNFEFYMKSTKMIALGSIIAALINIGFNFLFIFPFGVYGAIIATVISCAFLFLFHFMFSRFKFKSKFHYKLKVFLPFMLFVILIIPLFYLLKDYWILRWGIGAALGVFILLRTLKNKSIF
ncbi:MAG: oligosaccharide flippase family protein [Eubacterium sp.]|jgi:O-antigen/teichoic acid export membrane protein|nr:oligosaccharide flippase family protein [Eubacterium sp.]